MFRVLSQRPGLAHQGSDTSADGQIDPFNESGLDEGCKAIQLQDNVQVFALTPKHAHDGEFGSTSFATLDKLAIQQVLRNLPMIGASALRAKPVTEMGSDGVEIARMV